MSCDIHCYFEAKKHYRYGDEWSCLGEVLESRHYSRFGVLAGVRRPDVQVFPLRGTPKDCSEMVSDAEGKWGLDLHSSSYITMEEIINHDWTGEQVMAVGIDFFMELGAYLRMSGREPKDARIVFWFDN